MAFGLQTITHCAMTDFVATTAPRRMPDSTIGRAYSKPRPYRLPGLASPLPNSRARLGRASRRAGLVLIIDDSLHTRELYTEYLVHTGLAVTAAPEAETGLELAHRLRPDIIVMDIAMPGLNGITATHRLKQSPRTRRIPVIVLTGYAFRAIEQGALEAGADAFLTKPCLPEDLELKIRELLPPRRS
jgi:two-component system, cell cycle response regulator DivK